MALLLVVASVALPGWMRSFVLGLTSYHSYTSIYRGGTSPIGFLVAALVPASLSGVVTLAVSLGLAACVACACYAAFTHRLQASAAFSLAVVATLLLPGETGTTNQVLLLPLLMWWLSDAGRRRWVVGLVLAVLLAGPWLLFLSSIQGDLEHPMMVIPLPLATLLLVSWHARSKTARQLVATA
jgi:hypothetical protein